MLAGGLLLTRLMGLFKTLPGWFRAGILGAALVLFTLMLTSAAAEDLSALKARIRGCETQGSNVEQTLIRIETKLDRLILKLVGRGR